MPGLVLAPVSARAARGRTDCHRCPRRARLPRLVEARSEQLPGLGQRQGPELVTREPSGAMRPLERGRESARRLAGPHRHRDQHRRRRQAAQQRAEQLDRPGVGPVQVVQDQHERLARRPASPAGRAPRGGCGSARPGARRRHRCRVPRARETRARAPCEPSRPAAPAVVGRVPRRTRRARRRRPRTAGRARARTRSRRAPAGRALRREPRARRAGASCRCRARRRSRPRPGCRRPAPRAVRRRRRARRVVRRVAQPQASARALGTLDGAGELDAR